MPETKRCPGCGKNKPFASYHFNKSGKRAGKPLDYCKDCCRDRNRDWNHRSGRQRPMSEARECSSFLGVHIAETVLRGFFETVEHMPYGFSGYDFICGKGKRIDVKSSCLCYRQNRAPEWSFGIGQNDVADYFLCLAFDNRTSLTPLHVWLIPGNLINNHYSLSMANSPRVIRKWDNYERPLDKAVACCEKMRVCSNLL